MSSNGFFLHSLTVVGPQMDSAEVTFEPGLNVISGPSDTGKSYIYWLINYMLGGSTLPDEDVPESHGYETAYLTIYSVTEKRHYTLARSLRGGHFKLYDGILPLLQNEQHLHGEHATGREDTISAFLLKLSGLANAVVLKKKGPPIETGALSFRDLVHYFLVYEERVFTKLSPLHRENPIIKTLESSVFRTLLTGVDDRSLVCSSEPTLTKPQRQSQALLLAQMVVRMEQQVAEERSQLESMPSLAELDRELATVMAVRDEHQQALQAREFDRQGLWRAQKKLESEMIVQEQTQVRFQLLKEHYLTDLNRLEAISEAEQAFAHLAVEACPVCGSPAEAHQHDNISPFYAIEDIQEASHREAQKIHRLLLDLVSTIEEQRQEYGALILKHQVLKGHVAEVAAHIEKELAPLARVSNEKLLQIMELRMGYTRFEMLNSQLTSLREQHAAATSQAKAPAPKQPPVSTAPGSADLEGFCLATEEILKSWRYQNAGRVTFDLTAEDIVVGGRARKSHGKGIRAILYAAFVLGLMRYCLQKDRPHPGFAVIDSPLVAYREADFPEGEELPPDFTYTFYQALSEGVAEGQVIILENEDPPENLDEAIHYIHFTKSDDGRYGFFPV